VSTDAPRAVPQTGAAFRCYHRKHAC